MTTFIAGEIIPLQGLDESSFGVAAYMDGEGRRFVLIKDASHNWGLWEQVGNALEARVVPLPGGKDEADASMVIHDNLIIVYFAARLDSGARPAQMCEVVAPGVKRGPWMGHIKGINKALGELQKNDATLAQKIVELERLLGSAGDAAIEGRVVALENQNAALGAALKAAGAVVDVEG
jgi:hypothetical protein